jgi:hypothetical protein
MVYDHRFGEGILVFMDNQAFARLSEAERAAYLKTTMQAVRSGTRCITPATRSLPASQPGNLFPDG